MKYTVTPCDFDYNINKQIIEDLIKEYPFLNVQLIGKSAVGRSIFSLSLGNNKKCGIYVGSVCGSDGLSGLILLLFIERLCRSVKNNLPLASVNVRKVLSLSGITVIPCLNPDGREIFLHGPDGAGCLKSFVSSFFNADPPLWQANAMGVDINLNFMPYDDPKNYTHFPSPAFFRGTYPESEPETRALTRLCRLKRFHKCLELHRGDDEIFFKSDEEEPASSRLMAKILSDSCLIPVSTEKHGTNSRVKDWFINEFKLPAFSVGVKGNENELYSVYSRLEEALTVFALF